MQSFIAALFGAFVLLSACSNEDAPSGPSQPVVTGPPIRVLMVTTTFGFHHDSIATAREVMSSLAASTGEFTVTATEDLAQLSSANLQNYDVLFFALTSGELPLSADQKAAIVNFVSNGKGFIGAHSASDTLYEWPDYGRLVGAYFKEHPWTETASVIVEDTSHPAATGIGDRFALQEEFYSFRENPRPRFTCCCGSTLPRCAAAATIRSPGRSRSAPAARTTTRSATFRARGRTRRFSVSFAALFGGLRNVCRGGSSDPPADIVCTPGASQDALGGSKDPPLQYETRELPSLQ